MFSFSATGTALWVLCTFDTFNTVGVYSTRRIRGGAWNRQMTDLQHMKVSIFAEMGDIRDVPVYDGVICSEEIVQMEKSIASF